MAMKLLTGSLKPGTSNLYISIRSALVNNSALATISGNEAFGEFQSSLTNVAGTEGLALSTALKTLTPGAYAAFAGAKTREDVPSEMRNYYNEVEKNLVSVGGLEGFSLQNFKGSQADLKAANMTLNAQAHLQTPAAEAMFTTISVKYEDEGAELVVRAAGLGTYAYGNTAWQSASELRPIFGLLRSGDMYRDEVLDLHPVYSEDADSETREFFAPASLVAPTAVTYMNGDAYGREGHLTQYLKVPTTIPNLLGLTQAPGQRPWTATDEIESNSITVNSIALAAKVGNADKNFFISTVSMSNNAFNPISANQSSDDRGLNLNLRHYPGFSVQDKDGNSIGETLFAAFKTAGYEPLLNISVTGIYQRQRAELQLNAGTVTIDTMREISSGRLVSFGRSNVQEKALIKTFATGSVVALKPSFNVSNTSRGNFGYRIEVFDARKHLSVQRRSPISVKFPISKDDVNQDSLNFAIEQMSVVINNQCSRSAFDKAADHLKYITSIDGEPPVGNNQGSNVLAGQHFVSAAAVNRSFKLRDVVSAVDSTSVFDAVCSAITNEISDITAALNTKSGLAAIAEYGGTGKIEWTVIVHQNLNRFIMRSGDARTIGNDQVLHVVETNFDSQIGQILIIPKNTSTSDTINPLGGVGVCVSKENILVQGNVTRDQQDFGVVMTMPVYKHWALCPIIGSLAIEDAKDFLGDEGLLTQLAHQRVLVDNIGDAGANVPVEPVDPTNPNG